MLESPKKMGRGCLSPSHLFGITLLLNVMLMKSRLIMMVLSRMMLGLTLPMLSVWRRRARASPEAWGENSWVIEMLYGFSIPLPIRYISISSVHIMITLPPAPSPIPPAILRSGWPDFDSHQQEENLSILKRDKRSISLHSVTYFHYSVNYCEKGSF